MIREGRGANGLSAFSQLQRDDYGLAQTSTDALDAELMGLLPDMKAEKRLIVYVDVDDTLVRSARTKTVPIPSVVRQVKELFGAGVELYCWSTVGSEYARSIAQLLGIEGCFKSFLPKPNILIDDQVISEWKRFATVHPLGVSGKSVDEFRALIGDAD